MKSVYNFNEHGVCMECNETKVLDEKDFKATILTACSEGKWYCGVEITDTIDGYSGCGYRPSIHPKAEVFDTEEDAIRHEVQDTVIWHLNHYMSHAKPENKSVFQSYIDRCNEFIANTYQLSLF